VWSRSREHGCLGSLKAVSVLCVFGPSLFWLHYLSLFSDPTDSLTYLCQLISFTHLHMLLVNVDQLIFT
jgi:hypothetical protein